MNIFHKVTLHFLKKNKTRTFLTVIGIMLSAAMICAVTTFISSMQNYALGYAVYTKGDWHGAAYNAQWTDYQTFCSDEKIEGAAIGQLLGYAEVDSQNEYKPYLFVIGCDKNFFRKMPVHLISGRLPENTMEILLPEHLSTNGGLTYQIGDSINLSIGERLLDGYAMWQNNPNYTYDWNTGEEILNDEQIDVKKTGSYTVVGIYERPDFEEYTAPGYTSLTVMDPEISARTYFDIYFKMKNPKNIYDFMSSMDFGGTVNADVLMFSGISSYGSFSEMLTGLAVIVLGLIMFGSISLIYNAFSISVSERTKQFGLLSSLGATKKQLKKMVIFEALTVSTIGIPLGIVVGIGGIGITLLLIGNKFASVMGSYDAPMRLCVSWEAVGAAIIISLITVLISAWIPSKRATKASAVEAIRQTYDIQDNGKHVKTSKLTYKLFGLPGVLASKHFKRNKKKYRTTVISLFMSIVLFVSASSFTDYLMESVTGSFGTTGYDLTLSIARDENTEYTPNEVLEMIKNSKGISDAVYLNSATYYGSIDREYLSQEYWELSSNEGADVSKIGVSVVFVNDEAFLELVEAHQLNQELFFNSESPMSIAFDKNTVFHSKTERYETVDALDSDDGVVVCETQKEIEGYFYIGDQMMCNGETVSRYQNELDVDDILQLPVEDAIERFTLQWCKTITDYPFYIRGNMSLTMVYPQSMMQYILPEQKIDLFYYDNFYMVSDEHAVSYRDLKRILSESGLNSQNLTNHAQNMEMERNLIIIIQVFSYGFIVLISLIAAANVFHTISTNIGLRRREFAMLKSVGMTNGGFNKMMNYECVLYGTKALLFGLPVSAVITYFIFMTVSRGYDTGYHLPWGAICIAILSVFLVVFSTMLYAMSKIKKENPIDALKNENL